ncbi:MAG: 30S ribosomal protein S2 [Nanoarchaeota archaeon]|nr:30S ribosomal protein S2 [Nanoarchaeota archaeon]
MFPKLLTIKKLIQYGIHQGYEINKWNPLIKNYLFGVRNNNHIIDLEQSIFMLRRAMNVVKEVSFNRGTILFVGCSEQKYISNIVTVAAKRCSQYYINHRWIGGTITNWKEIYHSIEKLNSYEQRISRFDSLSSRELKKYKILKSSLQGISKMNHLPDLIFLVGTNENKIILREAEKYHIPVISIIDSHSDDYGITYPIPGNNSTATSIFFYSWMISNAVLAGQDYEANQFVKNV